MTHFFEAALLTLVAIRAAIEVYPLMKHAHRAIHRKLGLKPGEKCSRVAAIIVVGSMILIGCVACAPVVHYALSAVLAAAEG